MNGLVSVRLFTSKDPIVLSVIGKKQSTKSELTSVKIFIKPHFIDNRSTWCSVKPLWWWVVAPLRKWVIQKLRGPMLTQFWPNFDPISTPFSPLNLYTIYPLSRDSQWTFYSRPSSYPRSYWMSPSCENEWQILWCNFCNGSSAKLLRFQFKQWTIVHTT